MAPRVLPKLNVLPLKKSQARMAPAMPPAAASTIASASAETTTPNAPKPSARSGAISSVHALTAVYIVFIAANNAPTAMMPPIS